MANKIFISLAIVVLLVLISAGAGYWWFTQQLQPVSPADTDVKTFVVTKGQALGVTANKLAEQGLVRNAKVFRYYAQFKKLDTQMQAGSYELSPSMSLEEIALSLTEGTEDIWITLPEGWRREEVAAYLAKQEALTEFSEGDFLDMTKGYEGTLFPDTYLIPKESTADAIFALLTDTFTAKVTVGLADQFKQSELTPEEVLTLASIVEREGRGYDDMRHVAGVLINRLNDDMALQADATLQYIEGENNEGKWWAPPSVATKQSTSPYNTYLYPGLPPHPIDSPGLDAIRAVLDPLPTNDYYYIHTPSGESYFSETLEQHNANIEKYLR